MTIKLRHLSRWRKLPAGEGINLPGERRVVDMEVNVEYDTRFDVMRDEGTSVFLGVVLAGSGPQRLQFAVDGGCAVIASGDGEVWYSTDDGYIESFAVTTASFTELEQRMEASPEMEIAVLKANIRLEQRRAEVAELQLAKRQREEAAAAHADPETGEVDGEKPAADDAGEGGEEEVAGDTPAPKSKP